MAAPVSPWSTTPRFGGDVIKPGDVTTTPPTLGKPAEWLSQRKYDVERIIEKGKGIFRGFRP